MTYKNVTRIDLIDSLVAEYGGRIGVDDVTQVVNDLFDELAKRLGNQERVEIRGFGTFTPKVSPARLGRNPKTGEPAQIPEMNRVKFKLSKNTKELLNGK